MLVMPGRNNPRELVIRFRAPTRDAAIDALEAMIEQIPDGYRWTHETLSLSSHPGGGRRVSVTLVIFHNDQSFPAMDTATAQTWFGALEPGKLGHG